MRSLPHGAGAAPDFALALTALLLPGAPAETGEVPIAEGDERQTPAATGKDLPEGLLEGEEKPAEDDDGNEADAPFAWFAMPTPPVAEALAGIALPRPVRAQRTADGQLVAAEPLGIELPRPSAPPTGGQATPVLHFPGEALVRAGFGTPAPVSAQPIAAAAETPAAPAAPAPLAPPTAAPSSLPAVEALSRAKPAVEATEQTAMAPVRIELAVAKDQPAPPPPLAQVAQPLLQPRAEAVQPITVPLALNAAQPAQPRRAAPREIEPLAATAAQASGDTARPHQIAPAHEAQQPALDTRRHEWMATMIDRIEALRDSPGSRETSIRLTPDALGTVDVSIRQEGDRVHVRIAADTQAARALLTEAQPRLAELAEARGIKLGQTAVGVDAGSAGQGQQPRQEAPRAAVAPVSAFTGGAEAEIETDHRIA